MGVASELPPEGRIEAKPASGPARMGAEAGGLGDDAIRALGSLFRLTEVFLWDDASGGISKSSTCHNSSPEEDSAGYASSAVSSSYIDSVQGGHSLPETVEGLPSSLFKYWYQRYSLFSKFDHGVKVDEEGWFSVTPEALARHHASRCGHGTVVDCFAGIGGNAIQFAMKSDHVIAIDIDPQKVDYAQHNATIYGVGSNIDFIKGDFFILALQLKVERNYLNGKLKGITAYFRQPSNKSQEIPSDLDL